MSLTSIQPRIAILVAGGFEENHITAVQRLLTKAKLLTKMIAPEQGLVNGWQNNAWGHYFTVDEQIGTAMGSDYEFLILVGGERGVAKLKTNPHARRIVNHFLEAGKPIAAIGAGVELLALSPKSAGLEVAAESESHAVLKEAQMVVAAEAQKQDRNVLTSDGENLEAWGEAMLTLAQESFAALEDPQEEAA